MGAKKPKKSAAQKQLERMQLQRERDARRERNLAISMALEDDERMRASRGGLFTLLSAAGFGGFGNFDPKTFTPTQGQTTTTAPAPGAAAAGGGGMAGMLKAVVRQN